MKARRCFIIFLQPFHETGEMERNDKNERYQWPQTYRQQLSSLNSKPFILQGHSLTENIVFIANVNCKTVSLFGVINHRGNIWKDNRILLYAVNILRSCKTGIYFFLSEIITRKVLRLKSINLICFCFWWLLFGVMSFILLYLFVVGTFFYSFRFKNNTVLVLSVATDFYCTNVTLLLK